MNHENDGNFFLLFDFLYKFLLCRALNDFTSKDYPSASDDSTGYYPVRLSRFFCPGDIPNVSGPLDSGPQTSRAPIPAGYDLLGVHSLISFNLDPGGPIFRHFRVFIPAAVGHNGGPGGFPDLAILEGLEG